MPCCWNISLRKRVSAMRPSVLDYPSIHDCRVVTYCGQFHAMTSEQTAQLATEFYDFVNDFFGETCVLPWELNYRVSKNVHADLEKIGKDNREICLGMDDGFAKGGPIRNKTTAREHAMALRRDVDFSLIPNTMNRSADYPAYYKEHIQPVRDDPQALKRAILKTFQEPERIHLGFLVHADIDALFRSYYNEVNRDLFSGFWEMGVSVFVLDDDLPRFVDSLRAHMLQLAQRWEKVNLQAGIDISEWEGGYRYVFGLPSMKLNDERFVLQNYSPRLYLPSMNWMNVVCRDTLSLLGEQKAPVENGLLVQKLDGGSLLVQCDCQMQEVTVERLAQVKRYLYPVIYPGEGQFLAKPSPLQTRRPRSRWEMVPVFEDELEVTDTMITFTHHSTVDIQRVRELMGDG